MASHRRNKLQIIYKKPESTASSEYYAEICYLDQEHSLKLSVACKKSMKLLLSQTSQLDTLSYGNLINTLKLRNELLSYIVGR